MNTVFRGRVMKKGMLILSVIGFALPWTEVSSGERDDLLIGIVSRVGVNESTGFNNPSNASMGFFIDYLMTKNTSLQLELQYFNTLGFNFGHKSTGTSFYDKLIRRDWSARLSFNCELEPFYRNFIPYVSVGAGEYFIYGSKSNIKRVKEHPEEENLDYDMREYFKRPGFFGAVGFHLKANPKTSLFIQSKCSILFDKDNSFLQPSNFTDYFSLTTGIRYSFEFK
jgi:hypothetical protein